VTGNQGGEAGGTSKGRRRPDGNAKSSNDASGGKRGGFARGQGVRKKMETCSRGGKWEMLFCGGQKRKQQARKSEHLRKRPRRQDRPRTTDDQKRERKESKEKRKCSPLVTNTLNGRKKRVT